ncbi:MAG TPA: glycosyltransferase [Acidimicrobiia bacterium]
MTRAGIPEVDVHPIALERLAHLIGPERVERFERTAADARGRLGDRRVVNVNSTATGGGVAELLQTLLAYARGAGIDARWVVIEGDAGFFEITKRIHNHLYGTAGDGGPLGLAEHHHYEEATARNAEALREFLRAGDVVILHDPQTAALARVAMPEGVSVVWRCHVGIDDQNVHSERAWAFLRPYIEDVDAFVFSRVQFAPPWIPRDRLAAIPPSIDPFSAKNEAMDPDLVREVLLAVGLVAGRDASREMRFTRRNGSTGVISRRVDLLTTSPLPAASVPIVLQASRWDRMKDIPGVMHGFADLIAPHTDAHLVLAGPETSGVADDPEADGVLRACLVDWERFPAALRRRIHLACVPMADGAEAAAIVNALQRHAAVVVQKSLAEGFGLTVSEAMWKARPVVGSAVGGIVDQIIVGETGWLVDAHDLEDYARAVRSLLHDPPIAEHMGAAGRDRVITHFLGDRHLEQWATLFEQLV